jgi:hypothetical protein
MTQVVLYMSQSMLIPSEPERVAAKSSEGENQLVEQNLVIGGPPAGRLHTFCSDVDEFGGDMPFGLARGDSAGESTNKPLALFGHACVRRAGPTQPATDHVEVDDAARSPLFRRE